MSTNLTKREIVVEIYRKRASPEADCRHRAADDRPRAEALADARNVNSAISAFEVQVRKQRIGRNPNKPEAEVIIPRAPLVKFKSGKILKQQLRSWI